MNAKWLVFINFLKFFKAFNLILLSLSRVAINDISYETFTDSGPFLSQNSTLFN